MLIFTRYPGESIDIAEGTIMVTVLGWERGRVKIGVTAPRAIPVDREEVAIDKKKKRTAAARPQTTPRVR